MDKLLVTLLNDGEKIADTIGPDASQLPKLFAGLVTRLGAELPGLAEYDIEQLLAAAEPATQGGQQEQGGVITSIAQDEPAPVQPAPASAQVAPSESAGTAQGGAPSESRAAKLRREANEAEESRAAKLRREANEAEAAENRAQAQATGGTAAGAAGGPIVSQQGVHTPTQDSSQ